MNKYTRLAAILFLILILISLATKYYGSTDVEEYESTAKYFSGDYNAKLRVSHSILYGIIHFPLVSLFHSFFIMKITSLIFLILIAISVYYISKKSKKALFLLILSPIFWYLAPWISPIQLTSLLFLWAYFFIEKYDKKQEIRYLIYSGLLVGLATAFWNTIIFPAFFLVICFFYKKNVNHLIIFLAAAFIGYLPALSLDIFFYRFPFYNMIKYLLGIFTAVTQGSIYSGIIRASSSILPILLFLLMIPFFSFKIFKKQFFTRNKRTIFFLIFTFLFFLKNPQIRYILLFAPILILQLSKVLTKKQLKIQIVLFIIISLLVINPYLIQIKYPTNAKEFSSLITNAGKWNILKNENQLILEDLKEISKQYPNQVFVVGNKPEDYVSLALMYWNKDIKEFVSIEDYNLQENPVLFEKTIKSNPRIADRRQILITGKLQKSDTDKTDYDSIKFAIGVNEPIEIENFKKVKKYNVLYLSEKA